MVIQYLFFWDQVGELKAFSLKNLLDQSQISKRFLPSKFDLKEKELEQFSGDQINFYELEDKKIGVLSFSIDSDYSLMRLSQS
ncbi:unnamed protein product [Paramecium sonneborni]|uniref:Uncharacterized protein n=1 Tax=Paramecium sonneborni TaxID=65129 RepID=A0A8S1LN22_9CILI|nr:unnamed protein product [Paramecium sonneborni]